jgi:hypothetical protein
MKTITRRTATLVAAGALGLGGLAVAAPALAGAGPFGPGPASTATADRTGFGYGMGPGSGYGMGTGSGMGRGNGDGTCLRLNVTAEQGTLTDAQKTTLAWMAQEEKLAHDLYTAFAARYDAVVFDHIAAAETQHLTAVRTLLQRYGLSDPTATVGVDLLDHRAAARLQLAHRVLGGRREQRTGAAQVDAAPLPHDHRRAEALAQLGQRAAYRRLRDAQGFRRSCEMALGRDCAQQGERRGQLRRELRRVVRRG